MNIKNKYLTQDGVAYLWKNIIEPRISQGGGGGRVIDNWEMDGQGLAFIVKDFKFLGMQYNGVPICAPKGVALVEMNLEENLEEGQISINDISYNVPKGASFIDLSGDRLKSLSIRGDKLTKFNIYFDGSSLTFLNSAFKGCGSLESTNLYDINTSKVTGMNSLFHGCAKLSSFDASKLDVSSNQDFGNMFYNCKLLKELDVSNWDTSKATNMKGCFNGCQGLTSLDVSSWNVSNVESFANMFYGCKNLETLDASSWNPTSATSFANMFNGCAKLTGSFELLDWNPTQLTNASYMFYGCKGLEQIRMPLLNESLVNASYIFHNCINLNYVDLDSVVMSNVTNASYMFYGCNSLNDLDMNFNFQNCTTLQSMFNGCQSLDDLMFTNILNNITTSLSLENISSMFRGCTSLTNVNLKSNKFDTGNVHNISSIFQGCENLESCILPSDMDKVEDVQSMFKDCINLKSFGWDSGSGDYVLKSNSMFSGCTSLNNVILWSAATVLNSCFAMFKNCTNLSNLSWSGMGYILAPSISFEDCPLDLSDSNTRQIFSIDRVSSGKEALIVTLSDITFSNLTDDDIAEFASKGYTITQSVN